MNPGTPSAPGRPDKPGLPGKPGSPLGPVEPLGPGAPGKPEGPGSPTPGSPCHIYNQKQCQAHREGRTVEFRTEQEAFSER